MLVMWSFSTGATYHDADATAFGYLPGQLPQQPQIYPADEELLHALEKRLKS